MLTKFPNPHPDVPNKGSRVMADIDPEVFKYLFVKVLPGNGIRQPIICTFFQKLYEACIAENIPPSWDYDRIERVNNILQRLNFNVESFSGVRPPSPRRTPRASAKSSRQPNDSDGDTGTASSDSQKT